MRKSLFALILAVVATISMAAQPSGSFEALTVDNTAGGKAMAAATLSGMSGCSARLAVAQIRFRYDGTAPTSTVGTLVEIGDTIYFTNLIQARAARFIRTGSTSGVLSIACWPAQ